MCRPQRGADGWSGSPLTWPLLRCFLPVGCCRLSALGGRGRCDWAGHTGNNGLSVGAGVAVAIEAEVNAELGGPPLLPLRRLTQPP